MALAGAGNPVGGSNPSGTSKGLNYVGDHAYANSGGVIITNGVDATLLEFTTGTSYLVGTFAFGLNHTDVSGSKAFGYIMSINDEIVFENYDTSDADGDMFYNGASTVLNILLPPFSKIKFEGSTTDGSNITCFGSITGRVYA